MAHDNSPEKREDSALIKAIREGEQTERVTRKRVFAELDSGDYTADRAEWLGDASLDELFEQVQEADRNRKA